MTGHENLQGKYRYSSTLSLTSALVCGGWSTPRPGRFTHGKETHYSLYWRICGPQSRSGQVRKISPPPGFDPRNVQPVASRYTDYAIWRKLLDPEDGRNTVTRNVGMYLPNNNETHQRRLKSSIRVTFLWLRVFFISISIWVKCKNSLEFLHCAHIPQLAFTVSLYQVSWPCTMWSNIPFPLYVFSSSVLCKDYKTTTHSNLHNRNHYERIMQYSQTPT
jgi:hypothetical protein